jgi:hypothetical protein
MAECLQTQCVDAGVVLGASVAFDLKRGGCVFLNHGRKSGGFVLFFKAGIWLLKMMEGEE